MCSLTRVPRRLCISQHTPFFVFGVEKRKHAILLHLHGVILTAWWWRGATMMRTRDAWRHHYLQEATEGPHCHSGNQDSLQTATAAQLVRWGSHYQRRGQQSSLSSAWSPPTSVTTVSSTSRGRVSHRFPCLCWSSQLVHGVLQGAGSGVSSLETKVSEAVCGWCMLHNAERWSWAFVPPQRCTSHHKVHHGAGEGWHVSPPRHQTNMKGRRGSWHSCLQKADAQVLALQLSPSS